MNPQPSPLPSEAEFREEVRAFAEREIAPKVRALGSRGLSYHHLGIFREELERADTFARVIISVHLSLNSLALYQWGTPDPWERWLRPQAAGEKLAGFALTEPDAEADAGSSPPGRTSCLRQPAAGGGESGGLTRPKRPRRTSRPWHPQVRAEGLSGFLAGFSRVPTSSAPCPGDFREGFSPVLVTEQGRRAGVRAAP